MNTTGLENNLAQSLKNLLAEWQNVKVDWRDQKAMEFEAKYMAELPQQAARAVAVLTELNALLREVRHDCE